MIRGIKIDRPELTTTDMEEVLEIIKANLILEANHFPFNPHRGIDTEKYLFEWQDEATRSLQTKYFQDRIRGLDYRISDVLVVIREVDKHINSLDIHIKIQDGTEAVLEINV